MMKPTLPNLQIRTLGPDDWPLHRDLRLRALADAPDAYSATLAEQRLRADAAWAARLQAAAGSGRDCPLLALLDGQPVGLAWVILDGADPPAAELNQVWVAPAARGRGAGMALLDAATAWARGAGAGVLHLGVTWDDSAAVRLYRRAGFVPAGPRVPLRPGSAVLSQPMALMLA